MGDSVKLWKGPKAWGDSLIGDRINMSHRSFRRGKAKELEVLKEDVDLNNRKRKFKNNSRSMRNLPMLQLYVEIS